MTNSLDLVQSILNHEDVEGFLTLGAPEDEYSSEARMIWEAIERGQARPREEELNELLRRMWQETFGPFSDEEIEKRYPALRRIAKRLAEALTK
jgi:hypothetical protein